MSVARNTLYIVAGMAASVFVVEGFRRVAGIDIDPSSDNNVFKRAVDDAVQAVTFDEDETLGGFLFEKINGTYDPNAPSDSAISRNLRDQRPLPTRSGLTGLW